MPLTDGALAMINLQAQIDGRERLVTIEPGAVRDRIELIELIALRGQIRSSIGDYERAELMAERLTLAAPYDGAALIARARAHGRFHRFRHALADLDAAQQSGADRALVDAERANVFQAVGRYDEAITIYDDLAKRRTDFESLGTMATLTAECGEITAAEALFEESRARYRGVSPIPLALLDFRRGHMWLSQGELCRARSWFESAVHGLPDYSAAQGHLAETEAAIGETADAVARLRRLATSSDDPEYAASLARILAEVGQVPEADKWRSVAAARYDELMTRHPEAFADHAAEFWLEAGDADRAAQLANINLEVRNTPRARELFVRATASR